MTRRSSIAALLATRRCPVNRYRIGAIALAALTLVVGCSSGGAGTGSSGSSSTRGNTGASTPGAKRIVTGILGNPYTLSYEINTAGTGSIRGVGETEKLI